MLSQEELRKWATRPEAANTLDCSERQIERWASDGNKDPATRIRREYLQVVGRKAMPVFCPDDINRIAKAKRIGQDTADQAAAESRTSIITRGAGGTAVEALAEAAMLRQENQRELIETLAPALNAFTAVGEKLIAVSNAQRLLEDNGAGHKYRRLSVPADRKLVVTMKEATRDLGLPADWIKEQVRAGRVKNIGGKRYKLVRSDLARALE